MSDKKEITTTRKLGMTALLILLAVLAAIFSWGLFAFRNLPFIMRMGFGLIIAFGIGWTGLLISNIRKEEKDITPKPDAVARIIFVFAVFMVILFGLRLGQLTDAADGMGTLFVGIILFVTAALVVIQARINRAEINLNEKLFQIESDLIALNGKMPVQGDDSGPETEAEE